MSITTIPPALYKYVDSCRAAQILRDLRIRFSQVSVLNDADEFRPPYKGIAPRAEIEKTLRERFPIQYPQQYAEAYKKLPIEKADQLIDEMVPLWADTVEANYENSIRKAYEGLDSNFGLLSLSASVTSKLMWSFYSDGGRGVVIEFYTSHAWFNYKIRENDSYRHLRQVQYVADREPKYLVSKDDAATREDDVLYTKTIDWEFEKEWRIIRGFNGGQKAPKQDPYGKDVFLFDVLPSAIQAVILGYRMATENETALRAIVSANANLKHIVFRRAVRNVDGKIEIVPDVTGIL